MICCSYHGSHCRPLHGCCSACPSKSVINKIAKNVYEPIVTEQLEDQKRVTEMLSTAIPDSMVAHPPHYNSHPKGIECIEVVEDNPYYNLGASMKYLWRVSWGSKGNDIQDLEKAKQYIDFELARRRREDSATP